MWKDTYIIHCMRNERHTSSFCVTAEKFIYKGRYNYHYLERFIYVCVTLTCAVSSEFSKALSFRVFLAKYKFWWIETSKAGLTFLYRPVYDRTIRIARPWDMSNWSCIQSKLPGLRVLRKWHFNGNTKHTRSKYDTPQETFWIMGFPRQYRWRFRSFLCTRAR